MRRCLYLAVALWLLPGTVLAEAVRFSYTPPIGQEVESVTVRGSFNGWGETAMTAGDDGSWSVTIELPPGEHVYKYFIDGQWPSNMAEGPAGRPYDPEADAYVDDGYGGRNAARRVAGATAPRVTAPAGPPADGHARIHYHRPDRDYGRWGLHVWEDTTADVAWDRPLSPAGEDTFGLYWDVPLADEARRVGFIIHAGDTKDPGADQFLELDEHGREIWIVSACNEIYTEAPDVTNLPRGDLSRSAAHWVTRDLLAWDVDTGDGARFQLHASATAGLELTADGVAGGESILLEVDAAGLPPHVLDRFPHLTGRTALRLPGGYALRVDDLLRGQLAVSKVDAGGSVVAATGIQIPGVLDELYYDDGPLGVIWTDGAPTVRVWAPTARNVQLLLFDAPAGGEPEVLPMTRRGGTWELAGPSGWKNRYYLFEVTVYAPSTGRIEVNRVTDPYARHLSANSTRSQLVDLEDPELAPAGWSTLAKPPLAAPTDIVLYELHVRDFSASDPLVPEALRGTFEAFGVDGHGRRHLQALAAAGLTHVHLLPAFDIATVHEDRAAWPPAPAGLSELPPDSDRQQALLDAQRDTDGYNWGYDPYHFGVPEGSYATSADGPARILEFRRMVAHLAGIGLRTVMDVVYNHTHAHGQDTRSVLDRIVPGYYHRLDDAGNVHNSTCCSNTASEHRMMEKLMIDDLVHWAVDYKVDGFRFDLMGHHMRDHIERARDALQTLTLEEHGVDGGAIYLYGEGWDFGEVGGDKRGVNATQLHMSGTGVGTFNDRMRDALRGGSPFTDRREQGYATGLVHQPNGLAGSTDRERLGVATDLIRVGLAGNLRDVQIGERAGHEFGGYTRDPQEAIQYASAHDNETLFDKIQLAAAGDVGVSERARMQRFALSVIAVAQGVPFFHAGSDLLRSKSMDADSYNSGDWFNRVDWSAQTSSWGAGLPPAEKNRDRWDVMRPLLAREDLRPDADLIGATRDHFQAMLRLRRASPLLRLRTGDDVEERLRFHALDRIDGVIVLTIDDTDGLADLDPEVRRVAILLNPTPETATFGDGRWTRFAFQLHAELGGAADLEGAGFDQATGVFTLPHRTVAVFVEPQ